MKEGGGANCAKNRRGGGEEVKKSFPITPTDISRTELISQEKNKKKALKIESAAG